uniref:Uncharacterized protein n=1 Tax=Arundo donax TaxID=35708 RepID=A0A0A9A7R9_ARUDO
MHELPSRNTSKICNKLNHFHATKRIYINIHPKFISDTFQLKNDFHFQSQERINALY